MLKKPVTSGSSTVKLVILAGKATPAPPVGTALGPKGINLGAFCKDVNAATLKLYAENTPVPVTVIVNKDKSYNISVGKPSVSYLVKQAVGITTGSAKPAKDIVGRITMNQIEEIAKFKLEDMGNVSLDAAMQMVIGTAKSAGIELEKTVE